MKGVGADEKETFPLDGGFYGDAALHGAVFGAAGQCGV
jgi:hypothetical protein